MAVQRAQQADALVSVARNYSSGGSEGCTSAADAYQVVVHVDGEALNGGEGRSDLPVESVKRLACDGSVVPMVDGVDGPDEGGASAEELARNTVIDSRTTLAYTQPSC